MVFDDILKDFCVQLGGGLDLLSDESGAATLNIDGMQLTIQDLPEHGVIVLRAPIGELPPEDCRERLYKVMLSANHNFTGTFGATLSIDAVTGLLSLRQFLCKQRMDGAMLVGEVERFVNTLEAWRGLVADFNVADLSELETAMPSLGGFVQV